MLKTGLHLFFCTLALLVLWLLDTPYVTGLWVRLLCLAGVSGSLLFFGTWYLSFNWMSRRRTPTRNPSWVDDDDLEPAYVRR
jgi:hypothetical protein